MIMSMLSLSLRSLSSRAVTATASPSSVASSRMAALMMARQPFSSSAGEPSSTSSSSSTTTKQKSLVTDEAGVHQTMKISKSWRNKPLFRRQGDVRFKTGQEAAQLLIKEANRRDSHETEFIDAVKSTMTCLSPIFQRNPKYAFVAKQLMEPERYLQFRVSYMDDMGVLRMNRGYRIQYSSSLGPYEGPLHFGSHVNSGIVKALGFDSVFSNALTGFAVGAAVGGADFNPYNKSEGEMQRFCQSYMTELAKYVGPDIDHPWMGMGVGKQEMGYLFGQYKRISNKSYSGGQPFLSGGDETFYKAPGFGVVHFAQEMLQDRHDTLDGKRCLILGSGKVALAVAEKLLEYGAIPLTFSDPSGHVYEPDGINPGRLKTITAIKSERGALLGRYIISSTSAQFNDPEHILDIPCDLCFPCGAMSELDEDAVNRLADNSGCMGVVEGGNAAVTNAARTVLRKRGMLYGPHTLTLTGPAIVHAKLGNHASDAQLKEQVQRIYGDVKRTASEFNARGDLYAGSKLMGFLRVANDMLNHGAV